MKTTLGPVLGACLLASCAGDGMSGDASGDVWMQPDVVEEEAREDATADDGPAARDGLDVAPDVTRSRDAATVEDAPHDRVDVARGSDALDAADAMNEADARDGASASEVDDASVEVAVFTDVVVEDVVSTDATRMDAPADAGSSGAVDRPPADTPAVDVPVADARPVDTGPTDCTRGVELPVVVAGATVLGLSLATSGDRHAVTWVTTDSGSATATWLAVLDADGNVLGMPRAVPENAMVVSLTDGFGLVSQGAFTPLDRSGLEHGSRITLATSARSFRREGDRIYWTVAASDGGTDRRVQSLSASGTGPVQETPWVIPAGFVPIAYGPSRVLVATSELTLSTPQRFEEIALDGATVRVRFDQRWSDGPTYVTGAFWDETTSAWIVAGLRHLPMSREGLAHAWSVSESGVLTPLGAGLRPGSGGLYYWPQGSLTRGVRGDFLALYANASGGGPVAYLRGSVAGAWSASGEFGSNYLSALPATWSDTLGRYTVLHGVNGGGSRGPETRLAVRCLR